MSRSVYEQADAFAERHGLLWRCDTVLEEDTPFGPGYSSTNYWREPVPKTEMLAGVACASEFADQLSDWLASHCHDESCALMKHVRDGWSKTIEKSWRADLGNEGIPTALGALIYENDGEWQPDIDEFDVEGN